MDEALDLFKQYVATGDQRRRELALDLVKKLEALQSGLLDSSRPSKIKGKEFPNTRKLIESFADDLLSMFIGNKFGLDLKSLTKKLPDELRGAASLWILFYVSWLYRLRVGEKYGPTLADGMLHRAVEQLENFMESDQKEFLSDAFYRWFLILDDATKKIGTKWNDIEIDFEIFAASNFLVLDHASPHYNFLPDPPHYSKEQLDKIERKLVIDVAEVLCSAKVKTESIIAASVKYIPQLESI